MSAGRPSRKCARISVLPETRSIGGPDTGAGRATGVVVRQLFREALPSVWVCGYTLFNARDIFTEFARTELRVRMLLDVGEAKGQSIARSAYPAPTRRIIACRATTNRRMPE